MYKTKLFFMLMAMFFIVPPAYSLKYTMTRFRLNNYVYYEILYKIEGVAPAEFNNVNVVEETSRKLVFEYGGRNYTAHNLSTGSLLVEMPDDRMDRYLTRRQPPTMILSQYQR